jgi:microsomal epoxide hydrolase
MLAAFASTAMSAELSSRSFLTSDGVRLHVLEAGAHGTDRPVLAFVPGWSMPASIFRQQLDALGARHPVAALDPRGQGESEVAPGGYGIARRTRDVGEFVSRYRRVVLVGWSLGALEALEYVRTQGAGALQALVLVDSSVGEEPQPASGGSFVAELRRDRAAAIDRFVRDIFRSPRAEAELLSLRDQALRMPLDASIALFPASLPREHWRAIARAFPKPLLYAVTPQFAEQAENLRRARPSTRVEVFADAGHALFADEAERFNRLLDSFATEAAR